MRRCRDERGVVLVIVATMMTVFLGMAALAIDTGYFDQQQRQAQSAADAAALAAAAGLPTTTCAGTCTATAQTAVNTYVAANMSGATNVVSYPSAGQIKVTVTQTVANIFGRFLGRNSTTVGASATAAATAGSSTLRSNPGSTRYAIFAKDSVCTAGHYGIQFSGGGNAITSGILTNGSVSPGSGGSDFGPSTYGPSASGCTWPAGNDSHNTGPTSETALVTTYPIDYTLDFPACTGACTGLGGTPSFCSQWSALANWSLSTVASGNIYCGASSGNVKTASTWNGAITVGAGGVGSASSPPAATYVAGSVALGGGGDYLSACGYSGTGYKASACSAATVPAPVTPNYPLIYATGSSSSAISGGGGGSFFFGDLFAPVGTISFNGGGDTTSFLKGLDVIYTGGGLIGDSPSASGPIGASSSGSISLIG